MSIYKKLAEIGIVPVVVLDDVKHAVPLAKALINGGLPAAEVTFRTDAALASIKAIKETYSELIVGAGTVLNEDQAREAIQAGAEFIVSPAFDRKVVQYCLDHNVPVFPGTSNPGDVQEAYSMGLRIVKFFPAEPSGGMKMIRAISAPYGMIQFIPTGGISESNMKEYLADDKILCIGGSWMVKHDLIQNEQFAEIESLCHKASEHFHQIRQN